MAKVQQISGIVKRIPFEGYDLYDLFRITFENSELGRMKRLLPLHEMAVNFGLVSNHRVRKRGPKPFFSPEGKVALVFLKMYTQLSAPKLMEQLNGNVHYQIFCDIAINPLSPLTNYKLIDDIVSELSDKLKIQQQQDILAEAWKPYMKNLETFYTDATCYESDMRYPTDQKLLWECVEKSYSIMCRMSGRLGIHRPRTKYLDVEKANMGYVKQRKHSKSQQRKLTRRLIHLLGKILEEIRKMIRGHDEEVLTVREQSTVGIITKVYRQQKNHFNSNNPRESIPDRIVSVSKPYVRPIVRGKEVKNVEFGAKSNNILVDGISFIEKLSFNAFSEGTRLEHCIKMHKRMFKVDAKKIGGDTGYAGASNRNLCKQMGIQTSFVSRGRPSTEKKEKDFVRQELAKVRATAMEGSFGTQKEHYAMRKIKARKRKTEILYIFFGIHTANIVNLARRMAEQQGTKAA